jgi:hypothetical protein
MATLAGGISLQIQVTCGKCQNTTFIEDFGYHVCDQCGYGIPTPTEQTLQRTSPTQ